METLELREVEAFRRLSDCPPWPFVCIQDEAGQTVVSAYLPGEWTTFLNSTDPHLAVLRESPKPRAKYCGPTILTAKVETFFWPPEGQKSCQGSLCTQLPSWSCSEVKLSSVSCVDNTKSPASMISEKEFSVKLSKLDMFFSCWQYLNLGKHVRNLVKTFVSVPLSQVWKQSAGSQAVFRHNPSRTNGETNVRPARARGAAWCLQGLPQAKPAALPPGARPGNRFQSACKKTL